MYEIEQVFELNNLKHFIHRQTHELLCYPHEESREYDDLMMFKEVIKKMEQNPNNYIEVAPISTEEVFIIMEDFTDTIHNISHHDTLIHAINKENPFRQFRYALEDIRLLDEWKSYKNKAFKNLAVKWVSTNLDEQKIV